MHFEIIGPIRNIETIATGRKIRELNRLRRQHGGQRWRKLKGNCLVRLRSNTIREAEVHWYEAHGVGRKEYKIKRLLNHR